VYDETQKQIKEKRKHYSEARTLLSEKIQEHEQPVRQHLLEQKASIGRSVQKVTLTCENEDPADVSLRFQQRKTVRRTKRLGLKLFRQMIQQIIDRRSKQLEERGIYRVRWKDFVPVLVEDLVKEINKFYQENREEVVHERVCMRKGSTNRTVSRSRSSDKGKERSRETGSSGSRVVREKSRKSKSYKKRRHQS
jgi:hypothetical protein